MPSGSGQSGLSDALRAAVERTYSATAGPVAETRERAQELLDDVVDRAGQARGAVTDALSRAQRARESVAEAISAVHLPAREDLTKAGREELAKLEQELAGIGKRLEELESSIRRRRG